LIIVLCCALTGAFGLLETSDQTKASDVRAVQSQGLNAYEGLGTEFTLVNLSQFAKENPLDPKIGALTKNMALGENASINLTQIDPGHHFGAHYHTARDEIDLIIKGEANMTIDGQGHLIKAGDLIYIPPGTVHDSSAYSRRLMTGEIEYLSDLEASASGRERKAVRVLCFKPPIINKQCFYFSSLHFVTWTS